MYTDKREEFQRERTTWPTWFHVWIGATLGILSAGLIGFVVVTQYAKWQLTEAMVEVTRQSSRAAAAVRALADQARREADLREAERVPQLAAQHTMEEVRATAEAEAARRETAWRNFYHPSAGCNVAGQSVECANDFIRAKRAFDAQYKPGGQ